MTDLYEKQSEYTEARRGWGDMNSIRTSRTYLKQQLSRQEKELAAYQKEYNSQIKSGAIKKGSTADAEAKKQINDIKASILDTKIAIENVDDTIREIGQQYLEAIKTPYDAYGDFLSESSSRWQAESDLFATTNGRGSSNMIRKAALHENTRAKNLEEVIAQYEAGIEANLRTNKWKVGDQEYTEAMTQLQNYRTELANTKKSVYELNQQILDINWFSWNRGLEVLRHYQSSLSSIGSLLDEFNTFDDKTAKITNYGEAQVNMQMKEMQLARKEVASYSAAIEQLNKEFADGQRSAIEYEDKYRELYEGELAAAQKVQASRKAILDTVRKGIEAETAAMSKLIDKRKEALQRQKEADDYARQVRDKNKEITKVQQQIAALSGDTTEATRAKIRSLQAELRDKQQEMDDMRRDHEYQVVTRGLDDEMTEFRETQDEKTLLLQSNLEYQDEIIKNALDVTTENYEKTLGVLLDLSNEYGISIPEALTKDFGKINLNTAAAEMEAGKKKIIKQIDEIVDKVKDAAQEVQKFGGSFGDNPLVKEGDVNGNDSGAYDNGRNTNVPTDAQRPETLEDQREAILRKAEPYKTKFTDARTIINEYKNRFKAYDKEIAGYQEAIKEWEKTANSKSASASLKKQAQEEIASLNKQIKSAQTKKAEAEKSKAYTSALSKYNVNKAKYDALMDSYNFLSPDSDLPKYKAKYDTPLRKTADSNGKVLKNLKKGATVMFTGTISKNYYQVKTSDGTVGWIHLNNLEKYASGIKYSPKGVALTDEQGLGSEMLITKKGVLRNLDAGTMIFNKAQKENLWELSKINATSLLKNVSSGAGHIVVQNTYGSLLTVNGNVDKDALPGLNKILDMAVDKMKHELTNSMIKNGFARR